MLDNAKARAGIAGAIEPIARGLLRVGLSADAVTWIGAAAVVADSVFVIARGHFLLGATIYGLLSLSDLLDGTMARISGTSGPWGAFLDSTLDRIVDAAVLISITIYFVNEPTHSWVVPATLVALAMGQITSYIRARAEAVGADCHVGIAERAERSLILWIAMTVTGFGYNVLPAAIALLAIVSTITVAQRIVHVRKQLA